uniref:Uncharacterized protein n=1 Tax=Candidatus Kentrum sp. FW TaxID=2126338 RepID=A0A450TII7_9GAMM|nr:MAG: hypothetical protein BECKFW1821C_GA0114237_101112 [Candidatus Kentron sp. FW]
MVVVEEIGGEFEKALLRQQRDGLSIVTLYGGREKIECQTYGIDGDTSKGGGEFRSPRNQAPCRQRRSHQYGNVSERLGWMPDSKHPLQILRLRETVRVLDLQRVPNLTVGKVLIKIFFRYPRAVIRLLPKCFRETLDDLFDLKFTDNP